MQTKYDLLALDLDGTLLAESKKNDNPLSPANIEAVKELSRRGVEVLVATGRMYCSALPYVQKLGLSGPVITYNGALIKDSVDDEILDHYPVPLPETRQIIQDTVHKDLHLNLYLDDILYVEKENFLSRGYEEDVGVPARPVGSLLNFIDSKNQSPTKLLVIEEDRNRFDELREYYRQNFADRLTITESKEHYLEFCALEASKGQALQKMARQKNIPRQRVMAVGDSNNDLSMLEWAGCGVAVENAAKEIKSKADLVIPGPENDGIAHLIEKYIN